MYSVEEQEALSAFKAKWREMEEMVSCIQMKAASLETKRIAGKVRLCYLDKPVTDVSVAQSLAAVDSIPEFMIQWRKKRTELLTKITSGIKLMELHVNGITKAD